MFELPDYFCFGSPWCIRKATDGCEICFRKMCKHHTHFSDPGIDFHLCSRCWNDMKKSRPQTK